MKFSALSLAVVTACTATPFFITPVNAQQADDAEVIEVRGVRQKLQQAGRLMDVIQKTEMLDESMIEAKNALSLTDALQDEPGVRVSNECSMCGVKRIMLNGMRGEHTTILVDGLPTHTMISGFYAVDAVATAGIDRIEIARGAGASLIAPEAIGGTVNIVTKDAVENGVTFDVAAGQHGYKAFQSSATGVTEDGLTGVTLVAQYDKTEQEDHDDNGVSEAPLQENQSLTARISHDLNSHNNVQIRLSRVDSEVFGGPMLGELTNSIGAALAGFDDVESEALFVDNDVRKQYTGKAWETSEWVKSGRDEAYVKWLTEQNENLTSEFAVSYAKHEQDSFYEGIDYFAEDTMFYMRAKFDYYLNEQHFISFGVDNRTEEMRSDTVALRDVEEYVSDSFDYDVFGAYVQDIWTPADSFEVALALRIDKVEADFIDPKKPGVEIDETIVSPRMDVRYFHSDNLTSRFSAGRGYRAPLSFFETDHGILDTEKGYQIEVDELERSNSFTYALSYEGDDFNATLSAARSNVEHLAGLDETEDGVPILLQLDETASVTTIDLVAGYQLTEELAINVTLENFDYNDAFKSSYGVAPVEERAGLEFNWESDRFEANWNTVWFGSRDLTKYGYEGFNIAGDLNSHKPLNSGSFSVTSAKVEYHLTDSTAVYAGVSNLFDYTQVDDDSPLFFNADGGYDVAYIYGPLNGRQFYAGVEVKL